MVARSVSELAPFSKMNVPCLHETAHAKISQLVARLPLSRQQIVFALLVPSCQQVCYKLFKIFMLQRCVINLVRSC